MPRSCPLLKARMCASVFSFGRRLLPQLSTLETVLYIRALESLLHPMPSCMAKSLPSRICAHSGLNATCMLLKNRGLLGHSFTRGQLRVELWAIPATVHCIGSMCPKNTLSWSQGRFGLLLIPMESPRSWGLPHHILLPVLGSVYHLSLSLLLSIRMTMSLLVMPLPIPARASLSL